MFLSILCIYSICEKLVNIITKALRFGYSFGYKMVTKRRGNFSLCLYRIFAIITTTLVIWHDMPFSTGGSLFELSSEPVERLGFWLHTGYAAAGGGGADLPDPA